MWAEDRHGFPPVHIGARRLIPRATWLISKPYRKTRTIVQDARWII